MDATAIKQIQETAIDAAANRLPESIANSAVLIPSDYELERIEYLQPGRSRFRGTFKTSSLADFVSYVKKTEGDKKQGFINPEKASAKVFFNLGDESNPGHADHTATLELDNTAPWAAMLNIDGKNLSQHELVEWLEDWRAHVTAYVGTPEEEKPMAQAIAAIRTVTIATKKEQTSVSDDFRAARSSMEDVEAKSAHVLPGGFVFEAEPYSGLPEFSAQLRLSVIPKDGGSPILRLRIVAKEALKESILRSFKEALLSEIGDSCPMTIGTFNP